MTLLRVAKLPTSLLSQLPPLFEPLCQVMPLGMLTRLLMEWLLDARTLEEVTLDAAPEQYTRELTMTAVVRLMIQVSAGNRASVFAAWVADATSAAPQVAVSYQALYGKLGRMNPAVGEALVRHSARRLGEVMGAGLAKLPEPLAGYRTVVVDGNVLTGTDRRLAPLRGVASACLPGKSLVAYEVATGLVGDLVLCEDAYTQERALVEGLVARLGAGDLGVLDRNFCTTKVVFGFAGRGAKLIVRQHRSSLRWQPAGPWRGCGTTDAGRLRERPVLVSDPKTGGRVLLRQVELKLFEKTRDGERAITLSTNLPAEVGAAVVAELYRARWTVEKHFQFLTDELHCEQPGLGKPRAALFAFAMALVAGNALAVVRSALRTAHGAEAEAGVSGHYLADEVASDYRSLAKLILPAQWVAFYGMQPSDAAPLLTTIAGHVNMDALEKRPRGPKKPAATKKNRSTKHKHRSTARLLNEAKIKQPC